MAAPQAVQIADRFHVSQNLWEACETLIKHNYPAIRQILGKLGDEVRPQIPRALGDELAVETDVTQPSMVPTQLFEEVVLTQRVSRQPIVRERPQGIGQGKATNLGEVVALNSRESKKYETYSRRLAIYQQVVELQ